MFSVRFHPEQCSESIIFLLADLGEAVLNLSQGTVSEILAKPRPWSALSIKGREPYIRMYSWFHDTNNVQKLLQWRRDRDGKDKIDSK